MPAPCAGLLPPSSFLLITLPPAKLIPPSPFCSAATALTMGGCASRPKALDAANLPGETTNIAIEATAPSTTVEFPAPAVVEATPKAPGESQEEEKGMSVPAGEATKAEEEEEEEEETEIVMDVMVEVDDSQAKADGMEASKVRAEMTAGEEKSEEVVRVEEEKKPSDD